MQTMSPTASHTPMKYAFLGQLIELFGANDVQHGQPCGFVLAYNVCLRLKTQVEACMAGGGGGMVDDGVVGDGVVGDGHAQQQESTRGEGTGPSGGVEAQGGGGQQGRYGGQHGIGGGGGQQHAAVVDLSVGVDLTLQHIDALLGGLRSVCGFLNQRALLLSLQVCMWVCVFVSCCVVCCVCVQVMMCGKYVLVFVLVYVFSCT